MSVSLCLRVTRQVERRCLRRWLPVLLRKCNHRCTKQDNLVEEVDLAAANTSYVHYEYIRCKGGRERGGKSWRCVRLGRPFSTSEFAERKCSLLEIQTLFHVGARWKTILNVQVRELLPHLRILQVLHLLLLIFHCRVCHPVV